MKTFITTLLIVCIMGVAVFGMLSMNHGAGHDNKISGCFGATAQRLDCPKTEGGISAFLFHFNAFKSVSLATINANVLSAFLSALALMFFIGAVIFSLLPLLTPKLAFSFGREFQDSFCSPQKQKLLRWLSLYENSPSVF